MTVVFPRAESLPTAEGVRPARRRRHPCVARYGVVRVAAVPFQTPSALVQSET